ncbi:transcription factor PHYTOCHROME INTERACTING FACTOR-LIKE 15-like [Fagus crenata]
MLGSTQRRMTSSLATLASMSENDCLELVWENGEVLMRDRSGRTQKGQSCIGYSLYPSNAQVENGGNMHMKTARSETIYSVLNDSSFLGSKDSDLDFTNYSSSQNGHLDSFCELYKFNLEQIKSKINDKQPTDSQIVLEHDKANCRHRNACKSSQLDTSDSLIRPSLNSSKTLASMGGPHTSTLPEHDSHPDKNTGTVNFSYLRPAALPKANNQSSSMIRPTSSPVLSRVVELKGSNDERPALFSSNPLESTVIEPASGSKRARGLQNQPDAELIPPVSKTKESLPDKHTEAFGRRNHKSHDQLLGQTSRLAANTTGGKPNIEKLIEPLVASSSVCSLGASNDPTYSLRRTYEDTEDSAYQSENVEEPQGLKKQAPARGGTGAKRTRTAEVHNLSERRRRDKINKKMRALKELIPNCHKVDKASMLDDAIEYLRTLQLQLKILSMGAGVYMPPMMLPMVMQRINATHLTHFSPMGAGMGPMRMGTGMAFSTAQFPTSQVGATALPGITGTGFQMPGFPGQALPMSVSHASFIPLLGGPSTQSVLASGISGAAPLVDRLGSAPPTNSMGSIQNINSELRNNANTKYS